VIAGQKDTWVDNRIGIEIFHALDVPYSQKEHVTFFDDVSFAPKLGGDHTAPLTIPFLFPEDEYDRQGLWHVIDAVSSCSLLGTDCDADLGDVGTRDGRPIRRAEATDAPRDVNWGSLQECTFFINPRPCPGRTTPGQ
ncbi:MAG: hypothetical protein IT198_06635, partial [Acidimicrobiia bacterium]|nr:hypothetical protein [Acidimicrobiia bacterium]